nr:hypothetical protein [Novosphingobium sp. B-7]
MISSLPTALPVIQTPFVKITSGWTTSSGGVKAASACTNLPQSVLDMAKARLSVSFSSTPSTLKICRRLNSLGNCIPFLTCLCTRSWNMSVLTITFWRAFSRVLRGS